MKKRSIGRNIALMTVFTGVALSVFSEGLRTVQIVGLLACGAVIGASLSQIFIALKANKAEEKQN